MKLLLVFVGLILCCNSLFAKPEVDISFSIEEDPTGYYPFVIRGEAEYTALGSCFFVPWNRKDLDQLETHNPPLDLQKDPNFASVPKYGKTEIQSVQAFESVANGEGLRFKDAQSPVKINFTSYPTVEQKKKDWLLNYFYPQPVECDALQKRIQLEEIDFRVQGHISYSLNILNGFSAVVADNPMTSLELPSREGSLKARHLALYLSEKKPTVSKKAISLGEREITFLIHSQDDSEPPFLKDLDGLAKFSNEVNLPFFREHFHVILTDYLESDFEPGLITINRSRRGLLNILQERWSNWTRWVFILNYFRQWFGGLVGPEKIRDRYFFQALSMHYTRNFLKEYLQDDDLLTEHFFLDLNASYTEFQNIHAARLFRSNPTLAYFNQDMESLNLFRQQERLFYVRFAVFLRYLGGYLKDGLLLKMTEDFLRQNPFKTSNAQEYLAFLIQNADEPSAEIIQKTVTKLLVESGWVDYQLEGVETAGTVVTVKVLGEKGALPVPVRLDFGQGDKKLKWVEFDEGSIGEVTFEIDSEHSQMDVSIDSDHLLFDQNRYNNSNKGFQIKFFPGNAKRFYDDQHVLAWLLYPARFAGEDLSIAGMGGLFSYFNNAITFSFAQEVENLKRSKYQIDWSRFETETNREAGLSAERTMTGLQVQSAYVSRRYELYDKVPQWITPSLLVKRKAIEGSPEFEHLSLSAKALYQPKKQNGFFNYLLTAEVEQSAYFPTKSSPYLKWSITSKNFLKINKYFSYQLGLFGSRIYSKKNLHPELLLDPQNQSEAGLRIDVKETERFNSLMALQNDLFFPFFLPIPTFTEKLFLMSNRIRYFLFYDWGDSSDPANLGIIRAYGAGVNLPIGADLSGVGTLSFLNFRLTAILESVYQNQRKTTPTYTFGLVGSF